MDRFFVHCSTANDGSLTKQVFQPITEAQRSKFKPQSAPSREDQSRVAHLERDTLEQYVTVMEVFNPDEFYVVRTKFRPLVSALEKDLAKVAAEDEPVRAQSFKT